MPEKRISKDVVALGDLILNMAYAGKTDEGITLYERQPAGAGANMLTQVARLGGRAALISTLGNDEHSRYLYDFEERCGVDMSNVRMGHLPTRIMFVYYDENNDRWFSDFQMERNDVYVDIDEVDYEMVKSSRYLNVKCMPFDPELPVAATTEKIIKVARENGVGIAVDAQWRGNAMSDAEKADVRQKAAISKVVKLTDVEMGFYYGETDPMKGAEKILSSGDTELVALTLDSRGCLLRTATAWAYAPAYAVKPLDTTGAGDSFMGALLYSLCQTDVPVKDLTAGKLEKIADFCNACAAYSTQFRGSLAHMATISDVESIRNSIAKHSSWAYFDREEMV